VIRPVEVVGTGDGLGVLGLKNKIGTCILNVLTLRSVYAAEDGPGIAPAESCGDITSCHRRQQPHEMGRVFCVEALALGERLNFVGIQVTRVPGGRDKLPRNSGKIKVAAISLPPKLALVLRRRLYLLSPSETTRRHSFVRSTPSAFQLGGRMPCTTFARNSCLFSGCVCRSTHARRFTGMSRRPPGGLFVIKRCGRARATFSHRVALYLSRNRHLKSGRLPQEPSWCSWTIAPVRGHRPSFDFLFSLIAQYLRFRKRRSPPYVNGSTTCADGIVVQAAGGRSHCAKYGTPASWDIMPRAAIEAGSATGLYRSMRFLSVSNFEFGRPLSEPVPTRPIFEPLRSRR